MLALAALAVCDLHEQVRQTHNDNALKEKHTKIKLKGLCERQIGSNKLTNLARTAACFQHERVSGGAGSKYIGVKSVVGIAAVTATLLGVAT